MFKLWGAGLLILGCFYLGYLKSDELKRKVQQTADFSEALRYMRCEITQKHGILRDILLKLGEKEYSTVGRYFSKLLEQLENDDPFSAKWKESIQYQTDLPEELKVILEPLGGILGQYDGISQGEVIDDMLEHLNKLHATQMEESNRLGRMYIALGVTGGVFIVILLV